MQSTEKDKKGKQRSYWPFRIRGEAEKGDDVSFKPSINPAKKPTNSIISTAIKNVEAHRINLKHGEQSLANEDCAFEMFLCQMFMIVAYSNI